MYVNTIEMIGYNFFLHIAHVCIFHIGGARTIHTTLLQFCLGGAMHKLGFQRNQSKPFNIYGRIFVEERSFEFFDSPDIPIERRLLQFLLM